MNLALNRTPAARRAGAPARSPWWRCTGSASPTPGPIAVTTAAGWRLSPLSPRSQVAPSVVVTSTPLVLPTIAAATPSAAPLPTAATQPSAENLLIRYHKSGGIAGIDETFSVYADGTTELRNKSGTVIAHADPSEIQALQTLLASPEIAALQIPVQPPVPDAFVYEMTLPGRAKPLIATDGADNPPASAPADRHVGAAEDAGEIAPGYGWQRRRPISTPMISFSPACRPPGSRTRRSRVRRARHPGSSASSGGP